MAIFEKNLQKQIKYSGFCISGCEYELLGTSGWSGGNAVQMHATY